MEKAAIGGFYAKTALLLGFIVSIILVRDCCRLLQVKWSKMDLEYSCLFI
jgi:hypothetical protein